MVITMHELTHLIDIPFGVIMLTLLLIVFLFCFNVFLFYKWSCSIEEYNIMKEDIRLRLDDIYHKQCERG